MTQLSEAKAILRNIHALKERRYVGDTNASDTLVDFAIAVERASLTARQAEALRLVYVEDLTQKSAGERMGIGQDVVSAHIDAAITKIDAIYEYIAWHNGELTEEDFNDEDNTPISA